MDSFHGSMQTHRSLHHQWRWLDLILPPLLISLSSFLYKTLNTTPVSSASRSMMIPITKFNEKNDSTTGGDDDDDDDDKEGDYDDYDDNTAIGAHLYRATTSHARFLPTTARHQFSYPVLFLGLDLDQLEHARPSKRLDSRFGKWFQYNPLSKWNHCMAIHSKVYLEPRPVEGGPKESIKSKLFGHLQNRHLLSIERSIDDIKVYTITMPAFLGFQDINPLTIHYVYPYDVEDSDRSGGKRAHFGALELVVLEVSNTFGEKHLYFLQCNVDEDEKKLLSYEHQWTFPRAFHVSPFNDRTGYYQVSLSDPLSPTKPFSTPSGPPQLKLKIVFLSSETKTKKFYADLHGSGEPLNPRTILSALLKWPFELLLTTPRILYQAMLLHYKKRLDVYPKPDPLVSFEESSPAGGERKVVTNPIETGAIASHIQFQDETGFEKKCRMKIVEFFTLRLEERGRVDGRKRSIRIVIQSGDLTKEPIIVTVAREETDDTTESETLTIHHFSNQFWTDLYSSPSIRLAYESASLLEERWSISNESLFFELFQPFNDREGPNETSSSRSTRWVQALRINQFNWSKSFNHPKATSTLAESDSSIPLCHPLDPSSFTDYKDLFLHFFVIRLTYWIFVLFRARFVKGTEPWEEWARWERARERRDSRAL